MFIQEVVRFVSFHDRKLFFETEVVFSGSGFAFGHAFDDRPFYVIPAFRAFELSNVLFQFCFVAMAFVLNRLMIMKFYGCCFDQKDCLVGFLTLSWKLFTTRQLLIMQQCAIILPAYT